MSSQESSNNQLGDLSDGQLLKISVSTGLIVGTSFTAFAWFCLPGNARYFIILLILISSIFWLFRYEPVWYPRFSYCMVFASFLVVGVATLIEDIKGMKDWFDSRNMDALGVPLPVAFLAAVAELIPAILWLISCCKHEWVNRGIDAWISKMSIYSILWDFILLLSILDPQSKAAEQFMITCFTSFLILSSMKESVDAIVTLRITDNNLV